MILIKNEDKELEIMPDYRLEYRDKDTFEFVEYLKDFPRYFVRPNGVHSVDAIIQYLQERIFVLKDKIKLIEDNKKYFEKLVREK